MLSPDRPTSKTTTRKPGTPSFWNDPDKRALIFQGLLILGLGAFFLTIVNNTMDNLEQRGITTGFDFLSVEAGFGILQSLIPYTEADSYGRTFLVG